MLGRDRAAHLDRFLREFVKESVTLLKFGLVRRKQVDVIVPITDVTIDDMAAGVGLAQPLAVVAQHFTVLVDWYRKVGDQAHQLMLMDGSEDGLR